MTEQLDSQNRIEGLTHNIIEEFSLLLPNLMYGYGWGSLENYHHIPWQTALGKRKEAIEMISQIKKSLPSLEHEIEDSLTPDETEAMRSQIETFRDKLDLLAILKSGQLSLFTSVN